MTFADLIWSARLIGYHKVNSSKMFPHQFHLSIPDRYVVRRLHMSGWIGAFGLAASTEGWSGWGLHVDRIFAPCPDPQTEHSVHWMRPTFCSFGQNQNKDKLGLSVPITSCFWAKCKVATKKSCIGHPQLRKTKVPSCGVVGQSYSSLSTDFSEYGRTLKVI